MAKLTQREKILKTLREVGKGLFHPDGYILVKDGHRWLSSRYFKQVMLISECNGRVSELRADGFEIATLEGTKDDFGFAFHRLVSEPKKVVVSYEPIIKDGVRMAQRVETFI